MIKLSIGMIVLNEEEFIEKNLKQHYNWSHATVHQIIIIEGAVNLFPKRNITEGGLSTDRTAEIIKAFPDPEKKITFVQGYWKNKVEQRNEYTKRVRDDTDYLLVIDCDEFYTQGNQFKITQLINNHKNIHSFQIPQIHLWKSFNRQVVGGYWAVPHTRLYKWSPGCQYDQNHNEIIGPDGHNYHQRDAGYYQVQLNEAYCLHFGFFRSTKFCRDKQDFYYNRGEIQTRPMYSICREAWFDWKEGDPLPRGTKLYPYNNEVPEVFSDKGG